MTIVLLAHIVNSMMVNRVKLWAVTQWEGVRPDPRSIEPAIVGRKTYIWLWLLFALITVSVFIALIVLTMRLVGVLIS